MKQKIIKNSKRPQHKGSVASVPWTDHTESEHASTLIPDFPAENIAEI